MPKNTVAAPAPTPTPDQSRIMQPGVGASGLADPSNPFNVAPTPYVDPRLPHDPNPGGASGSWAPVPVVGIAPSYQDAWNAYQQWRQQYSGTETMKKVIDQFGGPAWQAIKDYLAPGGSVQSAATTAPDPTQLNYLRAILEQTGMTDTAVQQEMDAVKTQAELNTSLVSAQQNWTQIFAPTTRPNSQLASAQVKGTAGAAAGPVAATPGGWDALELQGNPYYSMFTDPILWQTSDPGKLTKLQTELSKISPTLGGLLGTSYHVGLYGPETRAAWSKVLDGAIASGVSPDEYLQNLVDQTKKSQPTFKPPVFNPVADPNVEQGVIAGFQKAMGRGPTASELTAFKSSYRTAESGAYQQASDAQYQSWLAAHPTDPSAPQVAQGLPLGADTDPTTGARFPNVTDLTYQGIYKTGAGANEAATYQESALGLALKNLIGGSRVI